MGGIIFLNRFKNGSHKSLIAENGCFSHGILGNQLSKHLKLHNLSIQFQPFNHPRRHHTHRRVHRHFALITTPAPPNAPEAPVVARRRMSRRLGPQRPGSLQSASNPRVYPQTHAGRGRGRGFGFGYLRDLIIGLLRDDGEKEALILNFDQLMGFGIRARRRWRE